MPRQEYPHRVVEQVRRFRGRRVADSGPSPVPARTPTSLSELVAQWGSRATVASYWAERSAAVGRGEIEVFGQRWATTTSDSVPDWDLDPITGFRWPPGYCFDIPLQPVATQPVEIKYVWELNRLLYLLPLAAHAAAQQDEQTGRLCRTHLRAWILAHPPHQGVHWRAGIELAYRILVFVLVSELVLQACGADPDTEALVGRSVAEHADWIGRFPSRFSSANNHRVAELTGLLVAASAYPALVSADQLDRWWSEFESIVTLQFHPDGGPAEQATMYAFGVLEWLVVGLRLARDRGRPLSVATQERIAQAAGFLATVTDSGGHPVRFGDDDDSRLLSAAVPHKDMPRLVLELVGAELTSPVPDVHSGLTTFDDGGHTVWRSGSGDDEVLWVLDHAPLGMGHLAAHAHADTLSVFLHLGGRPVFIDQGTYLYHSGGAWRDELRSTPAHNTVAVDGQNSSVIAGPFSWRRGHQAIGRLISTTVSGSCWSVEADHRGYLKRYGIVHRRILEGVGPRSFRLTDHLDGSPGVRFRWSMLLAPGLSVVRRADGWLVRHQDTDLLILSVPGDVLAAMGEEAAPCSAVFGQLQPSTRLVLEGELGDRSVISVGFDLPTV